MATVHRGRLVKRLKNKGLHAEGATFGLYIYTRTFHNYLFALLIFPKCSRTNEWELARRWWLRDFNLCVSTTMVRHIRHPIMDAPTECAVHSKRVLWIILITHLVGAWVLCVCVFFVLVGCLLRVTFEIFCKCPYYSLFVSLCSESFIVYNERPHAAQTTSNRNAWSHRNILLIPPFKQILLR